MQEPGNGGLVERIKVPHAMVCKECGLVVKGLHAVLAHAKLTGHNAFRYALKGVWN